MTGATALNSKRATFRTQLMYHVQTVGVARIALSEWIVDSEKMASVGRRLPVAELLGTRLP
jgi:hypothetical protein